MARPSKSVDILTTEKKSHRTKAELKQRQDAEKALATGAALCERSEVAGNKIAHAEFLRVNKLLKLVGKNDALIETVINRYCTLQAECIDFERKRERFSENLDELMCSGELEASDKYRLEAQMQKTIIDVDKQIQQKRKMLFDIERENGFTIAAALRSIPKKVDASESPLLKALKDD